MLVLLLAVMCVAVSTGACPVAPGELAALLWAKATKRALPVPKAVEMVIWDIRGPRVLAALLVGAGPAASGAAYQGPLCNPLVSPGILGVSSGGARRRVWHLRLAAVLVMQAMAFAGGLLDSLSAVNRTDLAALAPPMAVAPVPPVPLRWRLDVMTLGHEEATSLGVSVRMVRTVVIAAATLMTAAAVSVSGVVG